MSRFRPDIEGLRAFAVGLVVLDHLNLWPDGGFIGVDVFFTISGFLITGLIADEITRTGRFSIRNFYIRRARRILPAAFAALLATWIVARIVFVSTRVNDTVVDIWWSLGFAANIRFANAGTSYFQTYQQPSLVQHYWSLAVEEQFYVIWPVLLLLVTLWARRVAGALYGRRVLAVAAVAVIASFAWSLYQTSTSPDAAYFSTAGRAWELGVGALVALAARQGLRVPARLSGPLCLVGLAGIVSSAALLDSTSTFPGPAAALPVLYSALILLAGCGAATFATSWHAPLTNPVSRYVGRVSFSLYLWHWPTILVVDALVSPDAAIYYPLVISAMATLTVFSYYAIEMPFHKAGHAKSRSNAGRPARRPAGSITRSSRARRAVAVSTLVACTLAFWAFRPGPAAPPVAVGAAAVLASTPAESGGPGPGTRQLEQDIATALQATAWPVLTPALADVIAGKAPPDGMSNCVGPDLPPADICSYGDPAAPKVALVVGDSTAQAYMQLFRHVVEEYATGWQVRFIGMPGCTFVDVRIDNPVKWVADACPARKQAAVDLIRQSRPDLVVVTSNFSTQISAETDSVLPIEEWAAGLERYTALFRADAKDVAFVAPPPVDADIIKCYTAVSVPADCISKVTENWSAYAAAAQAVATKLQARYIDSTPWFCTAGLCPAFVGTVATKHDIVHVSVEYTDQVAPAAFESFSTAGLFG